MVLSFKENKDKLIIESEFLFCSADSELWKKYNSIRLDNYLINNIHAKYFNNDVYFNKRNMFCVE
jgi:hypothetical protein